MSEPVVTTTMFTDAERAAWQVAVDLGLPVSAANVRQMVKAAAPHMLHIHAEHDARVAAVERERCAQLADDQADLADSQALTQRALIPAVTLRKFAGLLREQHQPG